jgi:hypothetical protein
MTDVTAAAEELPWDWIDRGWAVRREYERKSYGSLLLMARARLGRMEDSPENEAELEAELEAEPKPEAQPKPEA